LRRPDSDAVEFMFVSLWDSRDALALYAGGKPERPKYDPKDNAALLELTPQIQHFEVIDLQLR
jgi:hypothetical protein